VTFHKTVEELPPLGDYDITKGRTYWFNENEVLFPFGHGLSYTEFEYSNMFAVENLKQGKEVEITVSIDVQNIGDHKGDEVIQLYIRDIESSIIQPLKKLRKFKRINLSEGDIRTVVFELNENDFAYWDENENDWKVEPGKFEIMIGASSEDIRQRQTVTVK
jgi:beta-glucosidase